MQQPSQSSLPDGIGSFAGLLRARASRNESRSVGGAAVRIGISDFGLRIADFVNGV